MKLECASLTMPANAARVAADALFQSVREARDNGEHGLAGVLEAAARALHAAGWDAAGPESHESERRKQHMAAGSKIGAFVERKAGFARAALDAYPAGDSADVATTITDLIGDLGHVADAHGLDFDALVESGLRHWRAEGGGGGEPDDIAEAASES